MLEFFRQNVGGMLGLAIIGALVFVFALSFGHQSEGWGKGQTDIIAAKVHGRSIRQTDYEYALNMAGVREVERGSAEHALLSRQVLAGLVERQLLLEFASRAGVSASRDEAEQNIVENRFLMSVAIEDLAQRMQRGFFIDEIAAIRILLEDGYRARIGFLKDDGLFDLTGFQNWVRYRLGLSEVRFVEQQRLELIAARVRRLLVSGIRVSEREVRDAYERENDTVSIKYLRISPAELSGRLDPGEEDLRAWIASNRERVEQHYETNKFRYTNLEQQVRARHILLEIPDTADEEEREARRAEMERIAARLRAGEDFAALAREYSEDGSADRGGDLGWNPRGRMVPEFDEAMFALEPGGVSDIVETGFGLHLIKCDGIREGTVPFEEAALEIAGELYRTSEGRRLAAEATAGYLARLREGADLETLLEPEFDDESEDEPPASPGRVRTTPAFGRDTASIPGIGRSSEIVAAAFELTPDEPVAPGAFEVHGDFVVVQLAERRVPSDAEFGEQKEELAERLLALKQASWLRDRMRDLTNEARERGRIVADLPTATPRRDPPPIGPPADLPIGPAGIETKAAPIDEYPPPTAPATADDDDPHEEDEDGEGDDGE